MKWLVLALLIVPLAAAQPDLGPILKPIDELVGDEVPPVLDTTYETLGQNLSREDVRLFLDLNVTKAGVGILGLFLGSGKAELEASVHMRGEMRVISSERIRAAIEGENSYNIAAENATFLSDVYIPAEVFRASLSAELIAAFQEEQERALTDYLIATIPDLELLRLDISWSNVHPYEALGDLSLTEPPIVIEMDASFRYLRVESIPSMLTQYFDKAKEPDSPKKAYIKELKQDNSDPLKARNFYAAAAFSQLLNMSMQPGWSLDVGIALPRGYSLEYASNAINLEDERHASFYIGGQSETEDSAEVLVFSLTHRKAVTVAIFAGLVVGVGILNALTRWPYAKFRLGKQREKLAAEEALTATAS